MNVFVAIAHLTSTSSANPTIVADAANATNADKSIVLDNVEESKATDDSSEK